MKKIFTIVLLVLIVLKTEAQSSVFTVVDSLLTYGNYQKALEILENTEPKTFSIFEKTGSIYQTIGNDTKALENLKKAIEIEKSREINIKLAQVYVSAGLTSKAIETYENMIEKDTSNLLIANSLGKLYLSQNKAEKAEKIYRFLKKKDSLNPNYTYQLAEALSKQDKPFEMGQSYLDTYNLDTLHINSMFELAKFFKELRIKDSTMLFIDKGLRIDSLNINFLQLKANELYFSKDFEEAIVYLTKLHDLNFSSLNTLEMFGMCYLNLNEFELAEKYFKNALKIDHQNSKILYRLGTLYYEQKNYKVAQLYLMQSIMYGKGDLDKQYFLSGVIKKEENELQDAIKYFDEAIKNNSKNYKALFELATTSDVFYKDKKIAYKYYQNYLRNFKTADQIMTDYATQRTLEIKKELFIEGEIIE